MKITVTEHELNLILYALRNANTLISITMAERLAAQDPTNDGPEVELIVRGYDAYATRHGVEPMVDRFFQVGQDLKNTPGVE